MITGASPSGPLSAVALTARVEALNTLLRSGRISMFKQGSQLLYKVAQPADSRSKGLSAEELLVYQVIKQAGNTGVWTRDMKVRTNLGQPQITKILKALESRSLIKNVKNVNNPSKKLYMLYELEPSREITGGAWYTDQHLDREFIEVLREACFKLIQRSESPHASLTDIATFINSKGLARVELREEDIYTLLHTLICDGRIEAIEEPDDEEGLERYRVAVLPVPDTTALTSIPCGVCPVIDQCCEGGQVSPQACVYYQAWLEF
eukprot:GHRR01021929.1.p1 GENE.GHRR01021929.1~~GHRR01021929.1.p1  ORF type:complete len:264 (+),score=56.92 GHRR01021929.1:85-876(+)